MGQNNSITELEKGVYAALETYSNVHRGSGHFSVVTTHLYEHAREIILEHLGLPKKKYCIIFCTPAGAEQLIKLLKPGSTRCLSSNDFGLPLGVRALAVKKKSLPKGATFQTGGGTARLVSPNYVVWARVPDRFEAGTPAIVSIITFARVLKLCKIYGNDVYKIPGNDFNNISELLYCDEFENLSGSGLLTALRQTLIGRNTSVPTKRGQKYFINLDNGASTPTFTPVWDVFRKALSLPPEEQKKIVDEVKLICSGFFGAPVKSYDIIFTSNTTEAINIIAESLKRESAPGVEPVVINTVMEHNSNELPWRAVPGCTLLKLSVSEEGFIDTNELETLLDSYNRKNLYGMKRVKLVAVTGASNVLGVYNDLAIIAKITHCYGARLVVDGAQLAAHRKINIEEEDIDYFAFSGHKTYAPFGSGSLIVKKGLLNFNPEKLEVIRNSGEENSAGIAALGKALTLLQRAGLDVIREEEQLLTQRLLTGLNRVQGIKIFGISDASSSEIAKRGGVISFELNGTMPNKVSKFLAEYGGIGVRSGCHCAHILIRHLLKIPPFLQGVQRMIVTLFPKIELPGMVRISLGIENTADDVDNFLKVLGQIAVKSKDKTHLSSHSGKKNIQDGNKEIFKRQMKAFVKDAERKVYL